MELLTFELLVIAAMWGWWAWRSPKEAFMGLPILLPAYVVRTKIGPIPTTGLELAVLATLIAWIANRKWSGIKEAWKGYEPWQLAAGSWLLVGLIAIFVAPDKMAALGLYRAYFIEPVLLFFMGMDVIRSHDDRKGLASNFGFIAVIIGVWSIVQYLTGWGIPEPWNAIEGRRAVGPFPFPNALALFIAPITALAFADRLRSKADQLMKPLLGWLTVISGIVAMILAKSDGGLIAFGAAALVALVMNKKTRIPAAAIALVTLIAIFAIPQTRTPAMERLLFKEWSGKVRLVMWNESVDMLKDRPIFGAGLGAYPTVIEPYHKADWMEIFQYPHNILLNLWSELGLLGILAFGFIIVTWLRLATSNWRLTIPILIALLVHGLVDVPYFKNDLAIAFWLLILITIPLYAKKQSSR
jgi:O-antigen ligase